jgi:NADPH:quinone reductase-like Zn-dependent oxidoreductase
VSYSFVFMRADGAQLRKLTSLIETGALKPVLDKVFPFDMTAKALAYIEDGRAKGKVVIKIV